MDYNGSSILALALLNKARYENVMEDVADGAQDRRFSRTLRLPAAHAVECRVEEVVPGNDAAGAHLATGFFAILTKKRGVIKLRVRKLTKPGRRANFKFG